MIFSSLFTPKWKSKKAEQRLLAITQLDTTKAKELVALNHLAQSDSDDKVRLAALKRLDDRALWWQVYQQETKSHLAKAAESEIVNNLASHTLSQSDIDLLIKRVEDRKSVV